MKRRFSLSTVIALMLLVATVTYLITYSQANEDMNRALSKAGEEIKKNEKFSKVRDTILTSFVGDVTEQELLDGAIAGMVNSLGDRYSHYLGVTDYQLYKNNSRSGLFGIGISTVMHESGDILVVEVYEGSPAGQAGLLPFERITAVEGQLVTAIGYQVAVSAMQGEENSSLELTVLSGDGRERRVTAVRRDLKVSLIRSEILEGQNLGYVRIRSFGPGLSIDFREALRYLQNAGVEGLIFDVRYNPGGELSELCEVLDTLLPEGPIISLRNKKGETELKTSLPGSIDLPIAVLVGGNSFSAAEFFAAALREYNMALLIGEPTTGKGYGQMDIQLDDKSGLILSTTEYFTPQGHSLDGVGLTPDVPVELSAAERASALTHEQDRQLQAAIARVREAADKIAAEQAINSPEPLPSAAVSG